MSLWAETIAWFLAPDTWTGSGGVPQRLVEHVLITIGVLGVAAGLALPVGVILGHRRRGGGVIVVLAGAARAIPTLGLLTVLGLALGIGLGAPMLALIILAIPPLLTGAYAGVAATDLITVDAARAVGLSEAQIVRGVELPLAAPIIVGGLRSATLQVVATATLAAYTADAGLGRFIFTGLKSREYDEMIGGSILVVILALALDGVLALVVRWMGARTLDTSTPAPVTERST
ncbi:ABC transporter permease subunit [Cryobacterium sp. SO2]|uniref:ABC transporter permease n=1 Tax=Cryobacterium sp. SO2 TaxID=1897060 RepID=UPI00223CB807|nr:ABC transporter permease subunit [Cryobacterium sp. SO2]WEO75968.1 ABC transporter permease subunit [Cryobacterium sp. SO2]